MATLFKYIDVHHEARHPQSEFFEQVLIRQLPEGVP